ncbi:hypothetical protein LMG19083_05016 [Ralstonia psammae]|uniref:Tyr recombinase domain-containing protein n=1 Tax=Ralstonia psammae TaxID=3058598 RepID=A0ABM9K0X5_9RALS|nr:site-specific integrase [Ralstonia sp. LMG 19083]CAJ0809761.1 hypothetical protein LMG19083_05016 [Ralstonia sp. LMG 19083]
MTSQHPIPLLAPVQAGTSPRAPAKAEQGRTGYSDRGPRHVMEWAGSAFREWLAARDAELARHAFFLHPHAFRHAFGTAAAESGVPLDVRRSHMGNASPATRMIYSMAGARRRQREVTKLFAT